MSFFKVFQICYSYIFFINITSKQKLRLIVQTVISWCFVCLQKSVRSCIFQTVISWCFVYLQESVRSCICVLGVMYLCVRVHVFVCQRSCIYVLVVSILPISTIFLFDFGNVPTVSFFVCFLFYSLLRKLFLSFITDNGIDFE